MRLPASGMPADQILRQMAEFREGDADYRRGRTWSMVYWAGEEHHALLERAHAMYMAENALNPMAFKSLRRMEDEVVKATAALLNGDERVVGTMTSGGTESLLTAVRTARDMAARPWRRRPNMVLPASAHVAFDKAGHLFGVELRKVPVLEDGSADVAAMKRKIDRDTVLLVGSAPMYPWGTMDPIPELGALALDKGVPLHVDACFGGFIQPFLERLGVQMPAWDFRVPGVNSISADLHKFGYAAKGASVLLWRDRSWLRKQIFVATGWSGGIYASPSLPGTRPGGPIAAAWAAMNAMGEAGYLDLAAKTWEAAQRLRAGIEAIPGLRLLGKPQSPVVTWAAAEDGPDVYAVADFLAARGWSLDRQQKPPSIHHTVNAANGPVIDLFLADLREGVEWVKAHPESSKQGEAAMYGMMAKIPVGALVEEGVLDVLEEIYCGPAPADPSVKGRAKRWIKEKLGGAK